MARTPASGRGDAPTAHPLFRRPWRFVLSVPDLEHLPPAERVEIAFAGRSNVGKSSLINALVGISGLARTSNTPGRTQQLNFFRPEGDEPVDLVDMPGYGFAVAPKAMVEAWSRLVGDYLRGRATLARVFVLIDARHGLKANDRDILTMLDTAAVSYQVVLTKRDKLSDTGGAKVLEAVRAELAKGHPAAYPDVLVTSSESGDGLEELRAAVLIAARLT